MKKTIFTILSFFIVFNCFAQSGKRTLAEAKLELDAVIKEANIMIKSAETPPLAPPKCDYLCDGTISRNGKLLAKKFYEEFVEPEYALINRLLIADREYKTLPNASVENLGIQKVKLLLWRLCQRAIKLIKTYGNNKDYYYPVSSIAMKIDREYQLLGGENTGILALICANAKQISDDLLDKFKAEHDYKLINQILVFGKEAALLGCGGDNDLAKLMDALSFKVKYENELEFYIEGEQPYNYKAEGLINVRADANTPNLLLKGKNDANIIFGAMSSECGDPPQACTSNLKAPLPFPFEVTDLDLDFCDSEKITITGKSKFGPQTEDWILCSTPPDGACGSYQQNLPGVLSQAMIGYLVNDGYISPQNYAQGGFVFEMPLKNNNVEAGRLELVKLLEGGGFYKIIFTVTHTPNK